VIDSERAPPEITPDMVREPTVTVTETALPEAPWKMASDAADVDVLDATPASDA
jgi:hypothetical protein